MCSRFINVTDGQTDRRTDGRPTIANELWICFWLLTSESLDEAKQQEEICKQHIEELRKRKSLKLEEVDDAADDDDADDDDDD